MAERWGYSQDMSAKQPERGQGSMYVYTHPRTLHTAERDPG